MKYKKYLSSPINLKIVKFFNENPSSIDTPRGIATWINEEIEETKKALKELARSGILAPQGDEATSAYGYTTNTEIISEIKKALKKS